MAVIEDSEVSPAADWMTDMAEAYLQEGVSSLLPRRMPPNPHFLEHKVEAIPTASTTIRPKHGVGAEQIHLQMVTESQAWKSLIRCRHSCMWRDYEAGQKGMLPSNFKNTVFMMSAGKV